MDTSELSVRILTMITIVLKRWHWILFAVLWATELIGWWGTVKRAPGGACVVRFLSSFGWMGFGAPVVLAASSAFLNTVILAKLFEVFRRS